MELSMKYYFPRLSRAREQAVSPNASISIQAATKERTDV
jgi:hypothetical protein